MTESASIRTLHLNSAGRLPRVTLGLVGATGDALCCDSGGGCRAAFIAAVTAALGT